jgi:hypothetical protein
VGEMIMKKIKRKFMLFCDKHPIVTKILAIIFSCFFLAFALTVLFDPNNPIKYRHIGIYIVLSWIFTVTLIPPIFKSLLGTSRVWILLCHILFFLFPIALLGNIQQFCIECHLLISTVFILSCSFILFFTLRNMNLNFKLLSVSLDELSIITILLITIISYFIEANNEVKNNYIDILKNLLLVIPMQILRIAYKEIEVWQSHKPIQSQPTYTQKENHQFALSLFYGIIVRMYKENSGKHHKPHIHAEFSGDEVVVTIDGEVLEGSIPSAKMKLLEAWMVIHKEDLQADWELLSKGEQTFRIDPLK